MRRTHALDPCGSSPHGRGKLGTVALAVLGIGLIPARAGKTERLESKTLPARAHPRTGGENDQHADLDSVLVGSSPHGRGKLVLVPRAAREVRLIPARAGKTSPCVRGMGLGPAHPRTGGENSVIVYSVPGSIGSSPHGRGKRAGHFPHAGGGRLIPARAGKTLKVSQTRFLTPAHPRAGGENQCLSIFTTHYAGSSPRGRGKPCDYSLSCREPGLIPARAGKTITLVVGLCVWGSSPRGRGKLVIPRRTC